MNKGINSGCIIFLRLILNLTLQLSMLFQPATENLSVTQVNFLKTLLAGVKKFSAHENLSAYRLGTSANIQQIK